MSEFQPPALDYRGCPKEAGAAVEVHHVAAAPAPRLLEEEVRVYPYREGLGDHVVRPVEVGPPALDEPDRLVLEHERDRPVEEVLAGSEVCVEDRDEGLGRPLQGRLEGPGLEARPRPPAKYLYVVALLVVALLERVKLLSGLVVRVVDYAHPHEVLSVVVGHLGACVQKPVRDVELVVDRKVHGDGGPRGHPVLARLAVAPRPPREMKGVDPVDEEREAEKDGEPEDYVSDRGENNRDNHSTNTTLTVRLFRYSALHYLIC